MKAPVIERSGEELRITLAWRSGFYLVFGLLILVAIGIFFGTGRFAAARAALGPEGGAMDLSERFSAIFIGFIGLLFLFFEYYVACRSLNKTRILATEVQISVRHGPLPWPLERNVRVEPGQIEGFGLATRTERTSKLANARSSGIPFFRAEARLRKDPATAREDAGSRGGRRVALSPWFEDEEPAKAVAAALAERYGLPLERGLRRDR